MDSFIGVKKADMLNTSFGECFNCSLPHLEFSDSDELDPMAGYSEGLLCLVEEVQWLLDTLDTSKSNGPDGISAPTLKAVASSITSSVTKL